MKFFKVPFHFAVLWCCAIFSVLLVADFFFWSYHPFAVLLGRAVGSMIDVLPLLVAILIAWVFGYDWRAAISALVASAAIEQLVVLRGVRELLGRENSFDFDSFLGRTLGLMIVISVVAAVRAIAARKVA